MDDKTKEPYAVYNDYQGNKAASMHTNVLVT